jgi:hypothetical protein
MGSSQGVFPSSRPPQPPPPTPQQAEVILRKLTEQLAPQFEQQVAYTNTIALVGYAAFFAIWGFTRDAMTTRLNLLAAILMLISCSTFVLWEVYRMVADARATNTIAAALQHGGQGGLQAIERYEAQSSIRAKRFARKWALQLIVSLLTGTTAAALMAWSLFKSLVDQWSK